VSDATAAAGKADSAAGTGRAKALDPQAEIAYEVPIDLLNEVVGIYSARLWDAEHAVSPDPDVAAALRRSMAHWVKVREGLRPDDQQEVARISQECGAIIRDFREGPRVSRRGPRP